MSHITITADSNERPSGEHDPRAKRAAKLAEAVLDDARFSWGGYEELPVDLQFRLSDTVIEKSDSILYPDRVGYHKPKKVKVGPDRIFNVELKEPADYISSALGKDGHLYEQVLKMRELGHPCMVLVLGSDDAILDGILDGTKTRYRGAERSYQVASYSDRLIDFEANCEALGCPVRRWDASPFKRLLSTANKILTGGNLMSYRPHPASGERELAAAAMLFGNGIGPTVLKPVMQDYTLRLVPKVDPARQPCDMPGIGPKRAAVIDKKISMIYGMVSA